MPTADNFVSGSSPSAPSQVSPPSASRREWPTPLLLLLLCAIPIGAGIVRLRELSAGAEITPDNARFFAAPLPIVLHIVAASLFVVLGAFQLVPGFRRRAPGWHRRVGWVLVPFGLIAAASGLWMQAFHALPSRGNHLLVALRWLFGSAQLTCLVLGVLAIGRRDFVGHGRWMLRAYAIALGAGTQSLLIVPWVLLAGDPPALAEALLMGAGWLINLLIAERAIRGRATAPRRAAVALG